MSAPTEASARGAMTELMIRDALAAQWEADYDPSGPDTPEAVLSDVVTQIAAPFVDAAARTLEAGGGSAWEPLRNGVGPLAMWSDLRPSQAVRLMQLVNETRDRAAARCQTIIIEEFTAAGVAFDAELSGASS
jgi:hypothetical protein